MPANISLTQSTVPRRTIRKPLVARARAWFLNTGWYLVLLLVAAITLLPFLWTAIMSVRENSANVFRPNRPPELIPYPGLIGWGAGQDIAEDTGTYTVLPWQAGEDQPSGWWRDYDQTLGASLENSRYYPYLFPATTVNYYRVWTQVNLPRYFLNSIIVAMCVVVLQLTTSSLAAYPLAKMRFSGRSAIFYALLGTLIFPEQLTLIPLYIMAVNHLGLYQTLQALVIPFGANVFGIFLLRQTYQAIPDELIEAARIDGASELGIWWRILLPLIRPGLATLGIFAFVGSWNSFLWPLLMLQGREPSYTLPVGLAFLEGAFTGNLRTVAAGVIVATVPILVVFILFQRNFIKGLSGAVKG